ncbi:HNH endonuclease [Corynebacterium aquatimens]|uniref:HNH endonuclease signature motif containing protein n=1 Tax=Corynebacterium aquatimens TaxID=1190508 RepID=UPI00254155FB|nr:HNH endonuclease signature motif containing protein [Corynebacterium aquatimens]QYH20007.1 HNH endonuclease [Corynebacterium aquatimens]
MHFTTEMNNDLCKVGQAMRDAEFAVFGRFAEPGWELADLEQEALLIATSLGRSTRWAEGCIMAYHALQIFPRLVALQRDTRRLDISRVEAIAETALILFNLNEAEIWQEFDQVLVDMFTPTKVAQAMPSPAAIRRRLNMRLRRIDAALAPNPRKKKERKEAQEREFPTSSIDFFGFNELESSMTFTSDAGTLEQVHTYINDVARALNLPLAEAAKTVFTGRGGTAPKVVLHVFAPKDDRSSYYLPNFGWTDSSGTAELDALMEERPPKIVDLDAAAEATTESYTPTAAMKAFVQARDGHCIYPNCDKPATKCQLDHRIPFGAGGPTTASNLFCLCATHHNRKTDKKAFYLPDPATGDIVWLFADGTYATTQPEGILTRFTAPTSPRWATTLAQKQQRLADAAEFDARCHAAVEKYEHSRDLWECYTELDALEKQFGKRFDYWPLGPDEDDPYWDTLEAAEDAENPEGAVPF